MAASGVERQRKYRRTVKGRECDHRYTTSESGRARHRRHDRKRRGWYEDDPLLKELELERPTA